MPDRDKVSRCFLSVTLLMFLLALVVSVTSVAEIDGTANQSKTAISDTRRDGMLAAGIPHGPIAIDGDANFSDTALLEGWPGDGSPESPYMIDGLDIDLGGEEGYCISISNTRVNFTISNCNLTWAGIDAWGSAGGISLENVINGELVNNSCNNNAHGIYLYESNYNTVADNNCFNNSGSGISLRGDSDSNTIANNTCNSNIYGISLWGGSDSNTLVSNTCNSNDQGISTSCSSYNIIRNNTCNSNYNGIRVDASGFWEEYNTVADNVCNFNIAFGIFISFSEANTVADNTCNFNDIGIHLSNSDSTIVRDNTCHKNRIGIWLHDSYSNTLANNICLGNTERNILEDFDPVEVEVLEVDPKVLLFIGLVGIIMLSTGWIMVKYSRADISETWIGGSAIVKHGLRRS